MKDCTCDGRAPKVLYPMRITKDHTILQCTICGGKFGEWVNKIYPPDLDFKFVDDLT